MSTTKRDLVMRIAEETGLIQQDVYAVIQKTLDYVTESLAEGKNVELRNFGVFEVRERKQRIGRNPNRPEQVVTIPSRKVVKFKPGKVMKEYVANGVPQVVVEPVVDGGALSGSEQSLEDGESGGSGVSSTPAF